MAEDCSATGRGAPRAGILLITDQLQQKAASLQLISKFKSIQVISIFPGLVGNTFD